MKRLFFFLCTAPISFSIHAQEPMLAKIDTLVRNQQWVHDIPGYCVAVIANKQVVYKHSYGVQSLATQAPATLQSDFHMASVSKPFAATAILQLSEKKKLSLDDRLIKYLPDFTMNDARYKDITLHQMLTHTSGIPDVTDYEWHAPQNDDSAVARYVKSFSGASLDFAPGEKFHYSNAAFNLLAAVISRLTGLSFEEYMRRNVFLPAGMTGSSFAFDPIPEQRRTAPHILGGKITQEVSAVYPYNRIHAPSSTLHSNVDDLLKWCMVFLQHGSINGTRIISKKSWQQMTTPQKVAFADTKICISWFQSTIAGHKVYFHSGGDLGYRTFVGFAPEPGVAVVLMGNNELFDGYTNGFAIFRAVLSKDSLQLAHKSVSYRLKDIILPGGVEKVKQLYHDLQKDSAHYYDFSAGAVANLAEWLYDRGHTQPAIDVLRFCIELAPGDFHWYEYIGDVYRAWNKPGEAVGWYEKALAIAPGEKEISQKLQELQRK